MLSEEQIKQLVTENEYLQVQLEDLHTILVERERELEELKENAAQVRELRSMLDTQLDALQSMQNSIGDKERQAEGAEERELELQEELTDAARLQQQYSRLLQDHTYMETLLEDQQLRLTVLTARNLELEKIAAKVGELESGLANTVMERDELLTALSFFKALDGKVVLKTGEA